MIKANELRIGNYITYLDDIYVVNGIAYEELNPNKWRISFKTLDGKLGNAKSVDWIEPIPLTPEWMEMMGFVEDKQHECYVIWESESHVAIEYFDGFVHLVGHTSAQPMEHIQYVHQLQNLYFALSGEELNVRL